MFRKESIFSSKWQCWKMNLGSKREELGVWMGVCKYWGGFFYPPNPSQQNRFMHPQPPKGTQQTSPPFRNHSPTPVYKKCTCTCSLLYHSLSLSLFLFFLHLPSSPSLFWNYLTFDINITQLHLHLHLHFSLFFSLPSSPLSLSLSLFLFLISFVFLSEFFLWIVSLSQWIGGGCLNSALDQPPPTLVLHLAPKTSHLKLE